MELPPGLGTKRTSLVPIGILNTKAPCIQLVPATCSNKEGKLRAQAL